MTNKVINKKDNNIMIENIYINEDVLISKSIYNIFYINLYIIIYNI